MTELDTESPTAVDSRTDTLFHSLRVGALIVQVVNALLQRAVTHDLSKTQPPEVAAFDRSTPRLAGLEYGSAAYQQSLADLGEALAHHYAANPHHPEFHNSGIDGMTLIDVIEMLADWRASTERMKPGTGDLARSIEIAKTRWGVTDQLAQILLNTATACGWIPPAGEGPTTS
jgi:hypothetical protein